MADQKLRYRAELDASGFNKGIEAVNSGLRRSQGGVRRQSQAFTQLAYAMDDLQYGFRGVQNNLQQIAVTAGLSGPLILGITALTIAFGVFLDKMSQTEGAAWNLRGEIKKLKGEIEGLQGQIYDDNESLEDKIIGKWDDILGKQAKYAGFILGLQNSANLAGFGGIFETLRGFFGAGDDDLFNPLKTGNEQKQKDAAAAAEKKRLSDLKKANNDYYKSFVANLNHRIALSKIYGATATEVAQEEWEAYQSIDWDRLTAEQADAVRKKLELAYAYLGVLDEVTVTAEQKGNEIGQALQSGITNALVGLGNAIGEAIIGDGDIGEKFLSILGSFMQAFGAAIVAVGVAQLKFLTDLATLNPVGVIAAGVALIAAGAVVTGLARSGPGGSKSSRSSGGGSTPSRSVTPTASRVAAQNNRLVATVKGQDLRFVLQAAGDSYSARN